jgi:hypothetical protein
MLVRACCENGICVYINKKPDSLDVVEYLLVDDLFFVLFENGKNVIQSVFGGKCLVVDGSEFEFVKL